MKTVHLVRHGETEQNALKVWQGHTNTPLNSNGLVSTLAEIGVILLLFEVGLETNLDEFIELGSTALLVALIGVVAPFALGMQEYIFLNSL